MKIYIAISIAIWELVYILILSNLLNLSTYNQNTYIAYSFVKFRICILKAIAVSCGKIVRLKGLKYPSFELTTLELINFKLNCVN